MSKGFLPCFDAEVIAMGEAAAGMAGTARTPGGDGPPPDAAGAGCVKRLGRFPLRGVSAAAAVEEAETVAEERARLGELLGL